MSRHGHWPEHNCTDAERKKFESLGRQQKRRISFNVHLQDLRQRFGGRGVGGVYWPLEMNRRIARAIARDQARANWRAA